MKKCTDKIRELGAKIAELNRELTGSDMVASTDAEFPRHNETKQLITDALKTHRALEKKMKAIDVMIEEKSSGVFGGIADSSDDDDDGNDEGEGPVFDVAKASEVKSLKDARKTFEREQVSLMKNSMCESVEVYATQMTNRRRTWRCRAQKSEDLARRVCRKCFTLCFHSRKSSDGHHTKCDAHSKTSTREKAPTAQPQTSPKLMRN
jgi:hypothetical protein